MLTEKDYCDYDTCVALSELGCPIPKYATINIHTKEKEWKIWLPLYDAQKWLREEKKIIVEVFVDDDTDTPITYNIHKDGECVCHHHGRYWPVKEWEAALLEGIKAAVKLLKEK